MNFDISQVSALTLIDRANLNGQPHHFVESGTGGITHSKRLRWEANAEQNTGLMITLRADGTWTAEIEADVPGVTDQEK